MARYCVCWPGAVQIELSMQSEQLIVRCQLALMAFYNKQLYLVWTFQIVPVDKAFTFHPLEASSSFYKILVDIMIMVLC